MDAKDIFELRTRPNGSRVIYVDGQEFRQFTMFGICHVHRHVLGGTLQEAKQWVDGFRILGLDGGGYDLDAAWNKLMQKIDKEYLE